MSGVNSVTSTDSTDSSESSHAKRARIGAEITFGMGLMRGLSAIGLALLLFLIPDKSGSMVANKMGFFWLFSGISLLRLNRNDPTRQAFGDRKSRVLAVIGIFAGLLMVTRELTEKVAPEAAVVTLLGVVIILTGLIHLWSEVRVGGAFSRGHRLLHAILGVFEVILGLMLVISPLDQSGFTYGVVTIWALVFGILGIGDAIAQWMMAREASKAASSVGFGGR